MLENVIFISKLKSEEPASLDEIIVFTFRLYLVALGIVYPLSGKFLENIQAGVTERMYERFILGGLCLAVFGASFIVKFVKQRIVTFSSIIFLLLIFHGYVLLYLNQLHRSYEIFVVLLTTVVSIGSPSKTWLGIFSAVVFILSGVMAWIFKAHPSAPIFFAGHALLQFFLFTDGVTRRRLLESLSEEFEHHLSSKWLNNQYLSKMASLGGITGGISHEINNPLAIIAAQADLISEQASADQKIEPQIFVEGAEVIKRNAQRISRVVNILRNFSREGDQSPFLNESLKSILDDTIQLCQSRLKRQNANIIVTPIPDSLMIECQKTQISQLILNLLTNSLDALDGSKVATVEIAVLDLPDQAEITFTDNGPGIPPNLHEKLFHPFFTTKAPGKFMGLGLNIARGISQTHNGQLYFDANYHPGTRFVVCLPKRHHSEDNDAHINKNNPRARVY